MCEVHQTEATVTGGFNKAVQQLLGSSYQFIFRDEPRGSFDASYSMNMTGLMARHCYQVHMVQSFFREMNKPLPDLPILLDLKREPCGVPPGVVISPYSRSDGGGNKFWPHDRWIESVNTIWQGVRPKIYVIGAAECDDFSLYAQHGIEPYFDRPLAQVVDLILQSPLFLSVDNGISHIAHFCGMNRHVLLYPGCFGRCWVDNPLAVKVHARQPIDIEPKHIVEAAWRVFNAQRSV